MKEYILSFEDDIDTTTLLVKASNMERALYEGLLFWEQGKDIKGNALFEQIVSRRRKMVEWVDGKGYPALKIVCKRPSQKELDELLVSFLFDDDAIGKIKVVDKELNDEIRYK